MCDYELLVTAGYLGSAAPLAVIFGPLRKCTARLMTQLTFSSTNTPDTLESPIKFLLQATLGRSFQSRSGLGV